MTLPVKVSTCSVCAPVSKSVHLYCVCPCPQRCPPVLCVPLSLLFVITGIVRRYTSQPGDILLFNSCSRVSQFGNARLWIVQCLLLLPRWCFSSCTFYTVKFRPRNSRLVTLPPTVPVHIYSLYLSFDINLSCIVM